MDVLGEYENNYEDIFLVKENNTSKIYKGFNIIDNRFICLKIIDKKQLELGEYDFLIQQIKREEEITKICKSENIVNFYQKYETLNNIIYEFEYCETDLYDYYKYNGELRNNPEFFKNIVIKLATIIKELNSKGVIHRDIKPSNIYLKKENDLNSIKLGDFGCSIYIKDNDFEPIGTIIYSAPEIINNLKYNEKCDLWSLGITLYELYFGKLPYGINVTTNTIIEAINNPEKKFNYKKTDIPCLDFLFKKLLKIDPNERISYQEFFNYVLNSNFMKNMDEIKIIIENQIKGEDPNEDQINESFDKEKQDQEIIEKINGFAKGNHFPDVMNFPNASITGENKYNNIIYYDENIDFKKKIFNDSDKFERNTPGAFILCTNELSFNMIEKEILKQTKKDKRYTFNLITTGSLFEKVIYLLNQNNEFNNCIKNLCIYCRNLQKYLPLQNTHPKLHENIYNKINHIFDFINKYASKDIKPYPITKLIRYEDYLEKYKDRHFIISQFYGDLSPKTYQQYLNNMKELIKEKEKSNELKNSKFSLLKGFMTFDINRDIEELDKLIIKEYSKNTFYGDLNKWLMSSKMNLFEPVAYFTSRLMYSLNSYAIKNNMYCKELGKQVYRGLTMPYTSLLPYERVIGKKILLSAFTSTSENEKIAKDWSRRSISKQIYDNNFQFSIVYYITNNYKNNWVSNGINIQKESQFPNEDEYLFLPFSFYKVTDVKININEYTADIFLETIGKKEILEEQIKLGKEIEYNILENIIQIKK